MRPQSAAHAGFFSSVVEVGAIAKKVCAVGFGAESRCRVSGGLVDPVPKVSMSKRPFRKRQVSVDTARIIEPEFLWLVLNDPWLGVAPLTGSDWLE